MEKNQGERRVRVWREKILRASMLDLLASENLLVKPVSGGF
jgi:hypothetical protein